MSSLMPAVVALTALTANPATPAEKSPLSPDQITTAMKPTMEKIKGCFSTALKTKPTLSGQLDVNFTIKADGSVTGPKVLPSSTAREPEFESCVLGLVKTLKFPKPGKKVIVNYPFSFVSHTEPPADVEHASPEVEGVKAVFLDNRESLASCFGPEGKRDRDARVHLSLTVYAGGYPGDVKHDDQPSAARTAIADCLVSKVGELRFPPQAAPLTLMLPISTAFFEVPAAK